MRKQKTAKGRKMKNAKNEKKTFLHFPLVAARLLPECAGSGIFPE